MNPIYLFIYLFIYFILEIIADNFADILHERVMIKQPIIHNSLLHKLMYCLRCKMFWTNIILKLPFILFNPILFPIEILTSYLRFKDRERITIRKIFKDFKNGLSS